MGPVGCANPNAARGKWIPGRRFAFHRAGDGALPFPELNRGLEHGGSRLAKGSPLEECPRFTARMPRAPRGGPSQAAVRYSWTSPRGGRVCRRFRSSATRTARVRRSLDPAPGDSRHDGDDARCSDRRRSPGTACLSGAQTRFRPKQVRFTSTARARGDGEEILPFPDPRTLPWERSTHSATFAAWTSMRGQARVCVRQSPPASSRAAT